MSPLTCGRLAPSFLARKEHQVFDDVNAAPCFLGNHVEAGLGGILRPEAASRQLGMAEDAGQWVIHFVGNPCAKLSERGHLLRMHQGSLGLYQRMLAFLQTRGHPVEGNRQGAYLIGGLRMHPRVEVSLPDALSAQRKLFERLRKPARYQKRDTGTGDDERTGDRLEGR